MKIKINKFNIFKHIFIISKQFTGILECKYCDLVVLDSISAQYVDNYKSCLSDEEKLIKDIIE